MSSDNRRGSILNQIIVTVVIALLVGGTSPWWWSIVFPPPAKPTPTPQPVPTRVPPSSRFDGTSNDGWAVFGGTLRNPGSDGRGGGANNGFLKAEDSVADGRTSYYVAPSTYLGDWNDYSTLRIDLSSSGGDYYNSGYGIRGDIYLANGSMTALRLLPHRPDSNWETFVIPLDEDGEWVLGGGATSLRDVLDHVTDFEIRAEFGVGLDTTGLDNVVLVR